jgi:hypothetical protein
MRLDRGNSSASYTRCADVVGFWRMKWTMASRDLAQVVVSAQYRPRKPVIRWMSAKISWLLVSCEVIE